jgi:hypothetical protein
MPNARQTNEEVEVSPFDDEFSGFIFKIQANMDPKHRDRIAFMRVRCKVTSIPLSNAPLTTLIKAILSLCFGSIFA